MNEDQEALQNIQEEGRHSNLASKEDDEKSFKERLVVWLKDNELKLSSKHPLVIPSNANTNDEFWNELKILHSLCSPIWMLAEDFNIVRWPSKTNAKSLDKKNMTILNNIIQDFGLVDPPLSNNSYTWSNLRTDPIYSRLDRFLYIKDWESTFKVHHSKTMQRTVSDHFLITLESHHITWGPCPFRLNNASLNEKDFTKNFPTWWENTKIEGHPGYSFIQRLKILATRIKDWQKQKVLSYKLEKDYFTKEIEAIDKLEYQNLLTAPLH
ncbi:LINE-1 retrotransposable element ORF2 protein [Cucumis melo var. makuwa]|uniref:LINE-1 retrotransposable element ORF2 protein n=1 Tax=Cucumis melo var. makuwa TaxID=1194695 RepID=A0A5D3CR25_CUCMM|nr:LINE-1 retrotransposable element ORF2 protein [Cucumis melo var. makuwa]